MGKAAVRPDEQPPPLKFADDELGKLLLSPADIPDGLKPTGQSLTPNAYVAGFFADPAKALSAMTDAGRVQGAVSDFSRTAPPSPFDRLTALSSTTSWYQTVDGAHRVMSDPTMELVIHQFGLRAAEMPVKEPIGEEVRMFRGFRERDGPNVAAYLVLFRKQNVVSAVVVVIPNPMDDGGQLALSFVKRQARIPLSVASSVGQ